MKTVIESDFMVAGAQEIRNTMPEAGVRLTHCEARNAGHSQLVFARHDDPRGGGLLVACPPAREFTALDFLKGTGDSGIDCGDYLW